MNRNDIRATGFGVAGGMIATFAAIAFVENDLDTKISEAIGRWRLTPTERAEYDAIRRERTEHDALKADRREQEQADLRAKFRPDLLSRSATATELSQLSVTELISEIRYARGHRAQERRDIGYGAASLWNPQVDALASEFARRTPARMSVLDNARYFAAYSYVNGYDDEWMPIAASDSPMWEPPAMPAAEQPQYPPYPDFTGPVTAREA
ncbi:hypothetical protein AB0L82_43245 [Nocardia sp. NPDC052001]|uniref:hypothetical protein n=1 Tax=Nocardia sp. NPDC052001 TaxID=3154853 RepID=UPI003420B215